MMISIIVERGLRLLQQLPLTVITVRSIPSLLQQLPPVCTVFVAHALHNLHWHKWVLDKPCWLRYLLHLLLPLTILVFPPYSTLLAFWKPLTQLLRVLSPAASSSSSSSPSSPSSSGPLGKGYAKICSLVAACLLWSLAQHFQLVSSRNNHHPLALGPWPPDPTLLAVVVLLSAQVNCVLSLWVELIVSPSSPSSSQQQQQQHKGVQDMVRRLPARLSGKQKLYLLLLAIVNAVCEEGESRGFWRAEYQQHAFAKGRLDNYNNSSSSHNTHYSNMAQAFFFGLWHYNGIPSGLSGILLAFVYGMLMGYLQDLGQGLGLPIVAHTIADYYIFVHVARRQLEKTTVRTMNKGSTSASDGNESESKENGNGGSANDGVHANRVDDKPYQQQQQQQHRHQYHRQYQYTQQPYANGGSHYYR